MNKSIRTIVNCFNSFGKMTVPAIAGLIVCLPAAAKQETYFEEIVVTVQRRAQDVMEVPIAVTAMTGVEIEAAGIKDLFDMQQNVPGLIVGQSQTATTSNFNIRGVGSTANNFGVESSVGLYVDGVYRSRQSSVINDLVDLENVEIVRGPQGTLFGKNTAAGAISIHTVAPSQDRDAFINVTAGDYGLIKTGAGGNISINDDWAMRGTFFSSNRDGYVDDIALGNDKINDKDRYGVRLQLASTDSDSNFSTRIIADYSEIDETCCVAINRVDSLYYKYTLATATPRTGSDVAALALGGTAFANFPYPQPFLDALGGLPGTIIEGADFKDYKTALNFLPKSKNTDTGLSAELAWDLSNGMTVKSISAYRAFDTKDFIDGDFSDLDVFTRTNKANQHSFSEEITLSGEFGSGSTFVTGLYYFGQKIKQKTSTDGGAMFGTFVGLLDPRLQQVVDGVNAVSQATGGLIPPAADPLPLGTFAFDDVKQKHNGWAAFGQVDYSVNDKFIVTVGLRYTDEDKDIDALYTQTDNGPPPDLDAIGIALFLASQGQPFDPNPLFAVAEPNAGWAGYGFDPLAPRPDIHESISDSRVTGTGKLTFFPSDNTMMYASYSTGFKSGGTNTDRINVAFNPLFDPEKSKSYEVGFKGTFGPVQTKLTYYDTTFDDFQANSFFGSGFNLQNAGKLEIDGIEVELLWRPTDSTEVQALYTHNHGEYKSFVDGTAWDTYVFTTGEFDPGCPPPASGDPSDRPDSCSRTGDPIAYNPEDHAFLAITQDFNLSDSVSMFIRGEYNYLSDQFTDGDLDPLTRQDDYSTVNARLGFNFDNIASTLTFWGRNITDERYYHGSFDVPVTEDKMFSYPGEPSTYGVTFSMSFD